MYPDFIKSLEKNSTHASVKCSEALMCFNSSLHIYYYGSSVFAQIAALLYLFICKLKYTF